MSLKSKRLGSLADIFQAEVLEGTIRKIKLSKIQPSEKQPRGERKKSVEELANSIMADGLLQPIVVTKSDSEEQYKIIAGERRFHAVSLLGWTEVECKILNKPEKEVYKLAVIENLQRENLSAYDEAEAMKVLKSEYGYTDNEIGIIFGKSRNYISEILSISNLGTKELEICRNAGIDNKNLLVQAAQSYKKGDFNKFIQSYKNGTFRTIKEAKEFNKNSEILTSPKSNKNKKSNEHVNIEKFDNKLVISIDDPKLLLKIESKVKS
ncbi:MAG TPA: ParB/RepB/Spo0J family partition protein, partial [Leptospiraceae bacterium]|nr:ParB/RepB/Spo0J family partition protein [Leptospiraceae bacterium]